MIFPAVKYVKATYRTIFNGMYAWYEYETGTIVVIKGVKPLWLALFHELGHHILELLPAAIHYHYCLAEIYDNIWVYFNLSRQLNVSDAVRELVG